MEANCNSLKQYHFTKVAGDYDTVRPSYPTELINSFIQQTKVNENSKVLEIGCGTGQLTQKLAAHNFNLLAIDIGKDLLQIAEANCQQYPKTSFEKISFEDYQNEPASFDAIVSATAFHWVAPKLRFTKTAQLLKPNGKLVIIQNIDESINDKSLIHLEIAKAYQEIFPEKPVLKNKYQSLQTKLKDIIKSCKDSSNFTEPQVFIFPHQLTLKTNDYIKLLNTFSYQSNFEESKRQELYKRITHIIDQYGGSISINYNAQIMIANNKMVGLP